MGHPARRSPAAEPGTGAIRLLADTPLGPEGLPLRCRPSWCRGPSALERLVARAGRTGAGGLRTPVLGARRRVRGLEMVEATFLVPPWCCPGGAERDSWAYLHLNTLTDNHRTDRAPEAMVPVEGTGWWSLHLLLPVDALIGYRYVVSNRPLPADAGCSRAAWKRVHDSGAPDPFNPISFRDGFGLRSSLYAGPEAAVHPEWGHREVRSRGRGRRAVRASEAEEGMDITDKVLPRGGGDRRITLVRGGRGGPGGLLILLDGEHWRGHEVAARLASRLEEWSLLLVDAGPLALRRAEMTTPSRWIGLLHRCLDVAAGADAVAGPQDVVVVGQSLGGLVAADAALRHPELCAGAIAQSPSLWVGARGSDGEGELLGWLRGGGARELMARDRPPRLVIQAGSHERSIRALSRRAAELIDRDGALVEYREVRGGHDYAWWRSGLSWGLDAWERGRWS